MRTLLHAPAALLLGLGLALATPAVSPVLLPVAAHAAPSEGGDHGDGHHADHPDPLKDYDGDGTPMFVDADSAWGSSTSFGQLPVAAMWGFHLLNLLILVGVLVWFGRRPIAAFLRDRSLDIKKELEDSAAVEQEARSRYEELEQRLATFEDEVARMRTEADTVAASERERTLERAAEAATRIEKAAERTIRDETLRARRVLRQEAVELAVKLAEDTLRREVATSDRERLARDFLDALPSETGGPRG
jgi:F-type H+-transporting ATPase subunit b